MTPIEAKIVDSTHLELSKPIEGRKGRTVFVSLAESLDEDAERRSWLDVSATSLKPAYSDSEPDYSATLLKEKNPDFVG